MKQALYLSIIIIGLLVCSTSTVSAQGGVGINSSGNTADPSSIIDASSTTKGSLIPRMTTAQRDAITNPAEGLQIYNTDCHVFSFNAGTPSSPNWVTINSANALIAGVSITANPIGAICLGVSVNFTATPSSGITSPSYQWKVNGGDVGINSSTYSSTTISNGDVVSCVLTSNAPCVTSSPATSNALTMLVNNPPTITGTTPASTCGAGAVTLGATASAGIINWYAASSGGSSLGTGTSFTTSISSTTTFYADATANGCTTASRTAVAATVFSSTPAQPGPISGQTINVGGNTYTYSVSSVPFATSYIWSVPGGATVLGGQGTTSLTVNFGCSASGYITVVASNACGSSPAQNLSVNTDLAIPGAISGPSGVNKNSTETYSISAIPNATGYTWTVPLGTITSGQGTNSITVTWGSTGGMTNISVVQNNACGTSAATTLDVGINYLEYKTIGTTTWTPSAGVTSVEVLVVAGGGSGGSRSDGKGAQGAGGGGAGGVIYNSSYPVIPGNSYPVTVGDGGAAVTGQVIGNQGSNSVFGSLVAIGGGAGGSYGNGGGGSGGSGGGAGRDAGIQPGGLGTPGQGYDGGSTDGGSGGGGGGAGSAGGFGAASGAAGNGGDGVAYSISGVSTYYGGGGGGSGYSGLYGTGGLGGGGDGGAEGYNSATSGAPNTGGGGGADSSSGATGGSGIVIIIW